MRPDKSLLAGNTPLLILGLMAESDMYGYQMMDELAKRSNHLFDLKAGTLYPLLHTLEQNGWVASYDDEAGSGRVRKFYRITDSGKGYLREKKLEWLAYAAAVNHVLGGI